MSALYLWGKPIATQLTTTNRPSPHVLTIASPIIDISCGDNHCVVVTEDGAYGVGDNSEGQLGMRSVRNSGLALAKI
jgi:alpha-tubulin suppressor-like RCC1 family protein